MSDLRNADDSVLIGGKKKELQQLFDIIEEGSRKKGLNQTAKRQKKCLQSKHKSSLLQPKNYCSLLLF